MEKLTEKQAMILDTLKKAIAEKDTRLQLERSGKWYIFPLQPPSNFI